MIVLSDGAGTPLVKVTLDDRSIVATEDFVAESVADGVCFWTEGGRGAETPADDRRRHGSFKKSLRLIMPWR